MPPENIKRSQHMKKIICLLAFFAAFCVNVSFAEAAVRVEGENRKGNQNIDFKTESASGFSGGRAGIFTKDNPTADGVITYKFNITEPGEYNFSGLTSRINVAGGENDTDYYFDLNGRKLYPKDYQYVDNSSVNISGKNFFKYTYPTVNLKAGENVLKVYLDKNDLTYMDRKMNTYIDYFEFEKNDAVFSINKFDNENICFYQTDDVTPVLRTHNFAPEDTTYYYIARDIKGIPQKMDKVTVKQGEDSALLDLNSLPNGWYNIKIYTGGFTDFTGVETNISISDRVDQISKPFAVDTGGYSSMNESSFNLLRDYMVKAGIGTARDRTILGFEDYPTFRNFQDGYAEDNIDVSLVYTGEYDDNNTSVTVDFSEDLADVYQKGVNLSKNNHDGNIYEIFNEADGTFAYSPADLYASYFKAIAIGIIDGNANSYKGFCGLAMPGQGNFNNLIMQNGIMDYSDFYNYHMHTGDAGTNILLPSEGMRKSHVDIKNAYNTDKPIWVTEAGFYEPKTRMNELSVLDSQAKFFITQFLVSKIYGEDRAFFFTLPNYYEGTSFFGVFDENILPRAVYTSMSEAAAMLGKAQYKGILSGMPEGAVGAMFNDGTNDVALIISNPGERFQFYAGDNARVVDYQGKEKTFYAGTNGLANIEVGSDPIFIKFNGLSDERNYYPAKTSAGELQRSSFDFNDRIVIRQNWHQDLKNAKENGYCVGEGGCDVDIEVYNFNSTDANVIINAKSEKGFSVSEEVFELNIPANGKVVKTIKVTTTDSAMTEAGLRIDGTVDGMDISPSISRIYSDVGEPDVTPVYIFEESKSARNWGGYPPTVSLENATNGVKVTFDLTTDGYAYPYFTVQNPSALAGTDGISFYIDTASVSSAATDVFIYTSDGAYHLENYLAFEAGKRKVVLTWDKFGVWEGGLDLIPEHIEKIAIGVQGYCAAEYTATDICAFTAAFADISAPIEVSNIENDKHYYNLKYVYAQLPDKEYDSLSVKLDGEDTEYSLNGNKITIPVKYLKRGYYKLQITTMDAMNRANTKAVNFFIK